jgi:hypothetical protein
MTGNIRRLALDFGYPWFWPLAIAMALVSDYDFLRSPGYAGAFSGGLMLALQGTFSAPKIRLWRTLPVTDADIGHARWWQMIGIPALAIIVTMMAAIALNRLVGPERWSRHLQAATMLLGGLMGQFFYPVLMTVFTLAMGFARAVRSPLAILAVILIGLIYVASIELPILLPPRSQVMHALGLGLVSLVSAAVLYVTAPRWPQPVTQPMQFDLGGGSARTSTAGHAGQDGWAALYGMAVLRPVPIVASITALWVGLTLALKLDGGFILQLRFVISLMVILQISLFNATALRVLRALPGSALALTAYLFLPTLALVAAVNGGFPLIVEPWLTGAAPRISIVALSAMLVATALVLPAMIAVRQSLMSLVLIAGMTVMALIQFGWDYVPPPWRDERLLVVLTALAIGAGFLWMKELISRGTHVYRLQPFAPARWRGAD